MTASKSLIACPYAIPLYLSHSPTSVVERHYNSIVKSMIRSALHAVLSIIALRAVVTDNTQILRVACHNFEKLGPDGAFSGLNSMNNIYRSSNGRSMPLRKSWGGPVL